MKKGRGKQKGNQFEREVCKLLSRWVTNGERDDVFWRTAGSGGRATNRRKKSLDTANSAGDICALDDVGVPFLKCFAVELKRGYNKSGSVADLIDHNYDNKRGTKPLYEKWIEQAKESQRQANSLHWLIIYKRDQRVPCVMTDRPLLFYSAHFILSETQAFVQPLDVFLKAQPSVMLCQLKDSA